MMPFVPPGSQVEVVRVDARRVRSGDVIAFPGSQNEMVLHRVVRVQGGEEELIFVARGDAQTVAEELPISAVAYRAKRVRYRLFSYSTDGPVGRAIAFVALGEDAKARVAKRLCSLAWRTAAFAKRSVRRVLG